MIAASCSLFFWFLLRLIDSWFILDCWRGLLISLIVVVIDLNSKSRELARPFFSLSSGVKLNHDSIPVGLKRNTKHVELFQYKLCVKHTFLMTGSTFCMFLNEIHSRNCNKKVASNAKPWMNCFFARHFARPFRSRTSPTSPPRTRVEKRKCTPIDAQKNTVFSTITSHLLLLLSSHRLRKIKYKK